MNNNDIGELFKDSLIKYEPSDGVNSVFISYQSNSKDKAIELSNILENNGINTWYAPRNIELGEYWAKKLGQAISNCKALLLLYTREADNSIHVYREVTLADSFKKPILWIKLDSTNPDNLIYYLNSIQWYESNDYNYLCDILKSNDIHNKLLNNSSCTKKEIFDNLSYEYWTKNIYSFDTSEEAAECAARVYFGKAQMDSNKTILLPTGRSGKKIFYEMIKIANEYRKCPFGKNYIMNDTETLNVSMNDKTSRIKVINESLIDVLENMKKGIKPKYLKFYGLNSGKSSPDQNAEEQLSKYPPSVYGISVSPYMEIVGYCNGDHKESIINDGPKIIKISKDTQQYIDYRQVYEMIYTIGLGTVLNTELLMILAFDDNLQENTNYNYEISKSNAIKRLFKGKETSAVPLTMLRKHKNAYVIITKKIAHKAGIEDYSISNMTPKEAAECILEKK